MGLFDKIKDNAKAISVKAIEATREYDEDYVAEQNQVTGTTDASESTNNQTDEQIQPSETENVEDQQPAEVQNDTAEADQEKADTESRKSKITEFSKTEYEQSQQEKKKEETKQAAKERLAKSYTPSYKPAKSAGKISVSEPAEEEAPAKSAAKPAPTKKSSGGTNVGIIDITPKRMQDPLRGAVYARERVALSALASQRKLNGTVPLYTAVHMNFKTRVYINRIEYSGTFGKNTLPIEQVAWIKLRHGGTGVIIETVEGKRVVMVVRPTDRLAFADAVIKVQAMQPKKGKFKDTQTVRIDQLERFSEGVDELEKLAKLYEKGILSKDEFDAKKRQILGI